MSDKTVELAIEVPAETKLAVERAAAAQGISVSKFLENALRKMLEEVSFSEPSGPDQA